MFLLIICILSAMGVGKIFYHEDNTRDINEVTSKVIWNESIYESKIQNTTINMTLSQRATIRLTNIIYKGISNIGFIAFEVAKFGIELGYANPDYDYLWFAKWIVYIMIFTICLTLIPLLPIIAALFYLTWKGIANLSKIIRIYASRRKEHKHRKKD